MNHLTNCRRCGADTTTKEGIKGGAHALLEYDAEGKRLHKYECPKSPASQKKAA